MNTANASKCFGPAGAPVEVEEAEAGGADVRASRRSAAWDADDDGPKLAPVEEHTKTRSACIAVRFSRYGLEIQARVKGLEEVQLTERPATSPNSLRRRALQQLRSNTAPQATTVATRPTAKIAFLGNAEDMSKEPRDSESRRESKSMTNTDGFGISEQEQEQRKMLDVEQEIRKHQEMGHEAQRGGTGSGGVLTEKDLHSPYTFSTRLHFPFCILSRISSIGELLLSGSSQRHLCADSTLSMSLATSRTVVETP